MNLINGPILALTFMTLTLTAASEDNSILLTLAQVETGATKSTTEKADFKVGKSGELSRFQILPKIWSEYAFRVGVPETIWTHPDCSIPVARRILQDRTSKFKSLKGRNPTPFEVYALWHRPAEAYSGRYKKLTRERCERFEALYYATLAEAKKKGLKK